MLDADDDVAASPRRIESDHNEVGGIAADRLRSIIERWERLEEEVRALRGDQKDIMVEAKSAGLDPKIIKQVIMLRRKEPEEAERQETEFELYKRALGMA